MSGIYNNYNEMMNGDTPAKNKQLIKEYKKIKELQTKILDFIIALI